MDYGEISETFFDNRDKSIIIYSAPNDCCDLQILLDDMKVAELNTENISSELSTILAQGKHPFMIVRLDTPLTSDFAPGELISHLSQTPDDEILEHTLWFYLLTTKQLKMVLNALLKKFTEREVIKMTQNDRETFFTTVFKDELLIQIDFLSLPLPGSVSFA